MNLPIEFTTTIKPEKLTAFYRKARWKQSLWLVLVVIVATLAAFYAIGEEGETANWMAYLIPMVVLLLFWFLLSYFMTSFMVKKQFENNPSLGAVCAYALSYDTLSHYSELANGEFSWELVAMASITNEQIVITMKNSAVHLIDPDDLDEEQLKGIKSLLTEKGLL